MENVILHNGLQSLTFGEDLNQSMENVTLPSDLNSLTFGEDFNRSIHTITLPSGLKSLVLGGAKYQWNGEQWMPMEWRTMDAGQDDATCLPAGFIHRLWYGEWNDFDMNKRCRCPDAAQWCADNAYGVLGAGAAWMFPWEKCTAFIQSMDDVNYPMTCAQFLPKWCSLHKGATSWSESVEQSLNLIFKLDIAEQCLMYRKALSHSSFIYSASQPAIMIAVIHVSFISFIWKPASYSTTSKTESLRLDKSG